MKNIRTVLILVAIVAAISNARMTLADEPPPVLSGDLTARVEALEATVIELTDQVAVLEDQVNAIEVTP